MTKICGVQSSNSSKMLEPRIDLCPCLQTFLLSVCAAFSFSLLHWYYSCFSSCYLCNEWDFSCVSVCVCVWEWLMLDSFGHAHGEIDWPERLLQSVGTDHYLSFHLPPPPASYTRASFPPLLPTFLPSFLLHCLPPPPTILLFHHYPLRFSTPCWSAGLLGNSCSSSLTISFMCEETRWREGGSKGGWKTGSGGTLKGWIRSKRREIGVCVLQHRDHLLSPNPPIYHFSPMK